jgi:hypothetical protein
MADKVAMARRYALYIVMHAEEHNQRTGQYLYNSFPNVVCTLVAGKPWDPFHRDMSQDQIETWLNEHVIFNDNGRVVGLFSGNSLLWEDAHA